MKLKHLLKTLIAWAYAVPVCPQCRKPSSHGQTCLGCALAPLQERETAKYWESLETQWSERDALPDSSEVKFNPHATRREILKKLDTRFNSDRLK